MSATKKMLLAVGCVVVVSGILFYMDWSQRHSRGAPPPALACRMTLRQIDAAKQEWMIEKHKTTNDVPTWDDVRPYLLSPSGKMPACPSGGTYTLGRVGEPPLCSYPGHALN